MLVLSHLERLAESGRLPCLSYGNLGQSLELSNGQVRRICKLLQKEGALKVTPRYLKNGAQLENAYRLTSFGKQKLMDWRVRETPQP
ncbi:hypothetical protein H8S61_05670 [Eggerthella sp. NSJ-70]|nr:hypothetical protein [Eggerthella hominis]MBC5583681.1 hypothetical protein [Eggerthella hominis]